MMRGCSGAAPQAPSTTKCHRLRSVQYLVPAGSCERGEARCSNSRSRELRAHKGSIRVPLDFTPPAKRFMKQQEGKGGLLRRVVMTGPNSCVVPANAGTHNHRRLWLRKVSTNVPNTNGTAYGSRRSPGRRKMMQTVKHTLTPSQRDALEALMNLSPHGGRGECRMPNAPAVSCALGIGKTHTSNNEYPGITRRSRTQWF